VGGIVLRVLRQRDFRFVVAGQLLSGTGDWLLLIAAPYFVLRLTGSTLATGLTLAAATVPALVLGPVAGVLADRWDRRLAMIAADLARMASVCLMLLVRRPDEVALIYVALIAESCFSQLFNPASAALIPELVGRGQDLVTANSLSALVGGVARLAGSPLGGALYALAGFHAVVGIDTGSYACSAVLLGLVRHRERRDAVRTPQGQVKRLLTEVGEGLAYIRRAAGIRALFAAASLAFVGNAILTALVVPYVADVLHASPQALGLLFGAFGLGFVIGAPASHAVASRLPDRVVISGGMALAAVVFALTFNIHVIAWDMLFFVLIGPPSICYLVAALTLIPRSTPDRLMGRVSAAWGVVQAAGTLVGMLAGSVLGQHVGIVPTMNAGVIVIAVAALASLRLPDTASLGMATPVTAGDA
jgi:Na+/melibiose symporter-like transporter